MAQNLYISHQITFGLSCIHNRHRIKSLRGGFSRDSLPSLSKGKVMGLWVTSKSEIWNKDRVFFCRRWDDNRMWNKIEQRVDDVG